MVLAAGLFLMGVAASTSASAASLHRGSTGSSGAAVTGSLPGQVLWGAYQIEIDVGAQLIVDRDNILRLINPNGAANGNLAGAREQTVCAMLYVFDSVEEMGECCGCPLTSAQLATFSVRQNLRSNWGVRGDFLTSDGSLAVVAASPNAPLCLGQSTACNGGCDPTNNPGYLVTTTNNLLGSITREDSATSRSLIEANTGLVETALFDDAGGDPINLAYLQAQCGALVGNGTGGGICNCPVE
jgi:hypothetical protein